MTDARNVEEALTTFERAVSHLLPIRTREAAIEWAELRRKMYESTGELPTSEAEAARLRTLHDAYAGKRIFIIGNGPSLNRTDLSRLASEYTFATNRFYLMYDRIDWTPTFYTTLDWRVVPDNFLEINGLSGTTSFYDKRFDGLLVDKPDVYWYSHHVSDRRAREARFAFDISRGVVGAGSVVGSAIQIAYYLGFDPIYLIGCDLGYVVPASVRQEGQDVFGTGVRHLLTSTENDDNNHFDPRYFGTGRRWHDPNVKRMIEGHEQCYMAITGAGGRSIFNATVGGSLEVYPRVSFDSLFTGSDRSRSPAGRTPDIGSPLLRTGVAAPDRDLGVQHPLEGSENGGRSDREALRAGVPRSQHVHVDETAVVAKLLATRRGPRHVMIDVGAHRGVTASYFHQLGWTIYCFEPDAANRQQLTARYGTAANVTIDPRALSDMAAKEAPFFSSEQSSGISSLAAFHSSHRQTAHVEVATLSDVIAETGLEHIDFLKIDVEGLDLSVLRGVPWDRIKPDAIECEFEDEKTVPLGHTWRDIADYLVEQGYTVYVSEWHPVIRYGMRHDWRRLIAYDREASLSSDAWGNLLAFIDDPGFETVLDGFVQAVDAEAKARLATRGAGRDPTPVAPEMVDATRAPTDAKRPTAGDRKGVLTEVRARRPRRLRLLRQGRRLLADLWRRRAWTVPSLGLLLALAVLGLMPASGAASPFLLAAATLGCIAFGGVYAAIRVRARLRTLGLAVKRSRRTDTKRAQRIAGLVRLATQLERTQRELLQSHRAAEAQLESIQRTGDQRYETLRSAVDEAATSARAANELARTLDVTDRTTELEGRLSEQAAVATRLRDRIAASERQIGVMRYADAPRCMVFFGHHKCASRFFRFEVFFQIAEMTGARIRRYAIKEPPFHFTRMDDLDLANIDFTGLGIETREVIMFANATERSLETIRKAASDWAAVRVLRDPRQVFVSGYLHHRGDHPTEPNWVWDTLARDQPLLRQLSEEEGLLHELDSISREVIESQLLAPMADARILTLKLEDFATDPRGSLLRIAEFLKVPEIAGIDLSRTFANPGSAAWQRHFTPRIRETFKERYGRALIDLGYERDLDW